jgi:hypothetical protein
LFGAYGPDSLSGSPSSSSTTPPTHTSPPWPPRSPPHTADCCSSTTASPDLLALLDDLTLPWDENTRPAPDIGDPDLARAADRHRRSTARAWRILTTPPTPDRSRARDRSHGLDIDD